MAARVDKFVYVKMFPLSFPLCPYGLNSGQEEIGGGERRVSRPAVQLDERMASNCSVAEWGGRV